MAADPFTEVLTDAGEVALAWLLERCAPLLVPAVADEADLVVQWAEWLDAIGEHRLLAAAEHKWSPLWLAQVVRAGLSAEEAALASSSATGRDQVAALAGLCGLLHIGT